MPIGRGARVTSVATRTSALYARASFLEEDDDVLPEAMLVVTAVVVSKLLLRLELDNGRKLDTDTEGTNVVGNLPSMPAVLCG